MAEEQTLTSTGGMRVRLPVTWEPVVTGEHIASLVDRSATFGSFADSLTVSTHPGRLEVDDWITDMELHEGFVLLDEHDADADGADLTFAVLEEGQSVSGRCRIRHLPGRSVALTVLSATGHGPEHWADVRLRVEDVDIEGLR